jgi:hypothetical protein
MDTRIKSLVVALAVAVAAPAFAVPPAVCNALKPARFAELTTALNDIHAAAGVAFDAQNSSTANGVGRLDLRQMVTEVRNAWAYKLRPWNADGSALQNFDLSVDKIYDQNRTAYTDLTGSLSPYITSIAGIWLTEQLVYPRYWSGIAVFYYRAKSPQGDDLFAGSTTYQLQLDLHAKIDDTIQKARKLNADALACMGGSPW